MAVIRNINGTTVAFEPSMPSRIMFKKEDLESLNIDPNNLDIMQIEKALKKDTEIVPFDLVWELTNRCSLDCVFCYIHNVKPGRDITFEEAKDVIDKLLEKGLIHVTLTGGECSLNSDFLKIYRYFKENGVLVDVYTNGIFLKEEVYDIFKELPPNSLQITIYNSREVEPRPYNTVLRFKELNQNLLVKFTVTTTTIYCFEEVKNWCKENDLKFQFDTDIFDVNDPFKPSKYQVDYKTKMSLDRLKYESIKPSDNPTRLECLSCGAGNISLHINSNFELGFCSKSNERYSLSKYSFEEAYSAMVEKILKIKGREFKNCTGCYAKPLCRMCYLKVGKEEDTYGNITFVVDPKHCLKTKDYFNQIIKD